MKASFVEFDGRRTRILHEGDGRALILVHGLGTSAERWSGNIDPLGAAYATYAVDLYNSGFSSDVKFNGTPPQQVHCLQLRGLCRSLGIERASFVGSSYGGLVVTLLALEQPDLVENLVIVGSGSALHPPDDQQRSLKAARENGMRALKTGGLAALRQRMANIVFDPASVQEDTLINLLTANALPGRNQALGELYDGIIASCGMSSGQVFHRLEDIRQRTLIVTGREDPRANWQLAQAASRRIRRCQMLTYEKCGHAPMQEHRDKFNGDLLRFLEDEG